MSRNTRPITNGVSLPSEARAEGQMNESLPTEQRDNVTPSEVQAGPERHETGAYLPAAYVLESGNVRVDR